MKSKKIFKRRPYQVQALVAARRERVLTLFWTRRGRKSTTLGSIAFDEMSREAGRSVISASASLLLGTELINMTVSATEQAVLITNEAAAMRQVFTDSAADQSLDFRCADAESGKEYLNITPEDFADLYQSKRLEMRLYHNRTDYSRQMVIAPNPATARGWGGTVFRDEAGFTKTGLEHDLRMAVDPIFRDDPTFKMIYASNLPRDDRHPFFEQTMPPADADLPVNPKGNFYRGPDGDLIHRVTLKDAYAAGHVLYDNQGEPMSYEAFSKTPANRAQMPFNYDLDHVMGGSAAIDLVALLQAQRRGALECAFVYVNDDADFEKAVSLFQGLIQEGDIGVGIDVATTTSEVSNPTSITFTVKNGLARKQLLVVCWKEKRAAVARARIRRLINVVTNRKSKKPPKGMCVDGSNERYFAQDLADEYGNQFPVSVVVNSTTIQPPGYEKSINMKTYLGDQYTAAVNDGQYFMPAGEYFKKDQRQTIKDRGTYDCKVDAQDGGHGDTFDSGKLAEYALTISGGPFQCSTINIPRERGRLGGLRRKARRLKEGLPV